MFKKMAQGFLIMLITLAGMVSIAFAQVEVNKADQAALEGIKGIGPSTSAKILDARKKGGPFKSWPDLAERVKGIGDKTTVRLSDAGLTVNGHSLPNAGVVPPFAPKAKEAATNQNKNATGKGSAAGVSAGASASEGARPQRLLMPLKSSNRPPPQSPPLFPPASPTSSRSTAPASAR